MIFPIFVFIEPNFFLKYILIIFFCLHQNPLDPPPHPYLSNFMFFFSPTKTNKQTKRQTSKQKTQKSEKNKEVKHTQKNKEFIFLFWPTTQAWAMVGIPSLTQLEKTGVLSPRKHLLHIAS